VRLSRVLAQRARSHPPTPSAPRRTITSQKALVECAQSETSCAPCLGGAGANGMRTMKKMGSTPTLVLCSRNARPEMGLVRRLHIDQHGNPSQGERASKVGRINFIDRR
jgi:hypothetical protein